MTGYSIEISQVHDETVTHITDGAASSR